MQAENEALQQLVLEVAQNKQEAQRRVANLKQKYGNLLAKVKLASSFSNLAWRSAVDRPVLRPFQRGFSRAGSALGMVKAVVAPLPAAVCSAGLGRNVSSSQMLQDGHQSQHSD